MINTRFSVNARLPRACYRETDESLRHAWRIKRRKNGMTYLDVYERERICMNVMYSLYDIVVSCRGCSEETYSYSCEFECQFIKMTRANRFRMLVSSKNIYDTRLAKLHRFRCG